jgi:hypothetical protein
LWAAAFGAAELDARRAPSFVFTILNSTRRFFSHAARCARVLGAVLAVALAPEADFVDAALDERAMTEFTRSCVRRRL